MVTTVSTLPGSPVGPMEQAPCMGLMAQLADIVAQLSQGHQAMGQAVEAQQSHTTEMHGSRDAT
jgi:hypothetical protein